MRFGIDVPNVGDYSDPRRVAGLARLAEEAGWDGFFVWDHVALDRRGSLELADPWVLLTAVALATERIRFGPLVTPVARRRPSTLARQTATLDRLSGGRLVLGVGLGTPVDDEYGVFGEPTDRRVLAERLDEGLAVLTGLWSGEPVRFHGRHLTADGVTFRPTPQQRPRVPIWVAGAWPHRAPFRRAARWDGAVPLAVDDGGGLRTATAAQLREVVAFVAEQRAEPGPFDVLAFGRTSDTDQVAARSAVEPFAAAGATWWIEGFDLPANDIEGATARVRAGPPR